ncbi:Transposase IS200 like protein [compost metagenome]
MLAWVLMPDHVHWVLRLGIGEQLASSVGRLKSASSRRVNACQGRQGPLWAGAFHDHALRREDDLRAIARYVVANPLRAGLVRRVGDYPFWNAIWL